MPESTCPPQDQLAAFALGQLDDQLIEPMADHLDACSACESAVTLLEGESDTFIERFRNPVENGVFSQEPEFWHARAEIGKSPKVRAAPGDADSGPGDEHTSPTQLRDYRLLSKLGSGGMGTVYKALHTQMGRVVAVKTLPVHRRSSTALSRFTREIEAVSKLDHPNIVRAFDAGETDDAHFLAMEYIEGVNLQQLVRQVGPLSVVNACEIVRQAALGVQHAHEHGLIHRDIKPSNIMLDVGSSGTCPTVKVLDLGLARVHADAMRRDELTDSGQVMGTLDYMAPEQADDGRQVDGRTDVYSLGCTLYKLLTGTAPFAGDEFDTPAKKIQAHLKSMPRPVQELHPDAPDGLSELLGRLLAKDRANRPATPNEVADLLAPFAVNNDLGRLMEQVGDEKHHETSAASMVAICPISGRTPRNDKVPRGKYGRRLGTASAIVALVFIAAAVIFVKLGETTVRIEIHDPSLAVRFRDDVITIDNDGQKFHIQAGERQELVIEQAGLELETRSFTLRKGQKVALQVSTTPAGQLDVQDSADLKWELELTDSVDLQWDDDKATGESAPKHTGGLPKAARTDNFIVHAATPERSQAIGENGEMLRQDLAESWLGEKLPNWTSACIVQVREGAQLSPSGVTSFVFDKGKVVNMQMHLQGPRDRIDTLLKHELIHLMLATRFRQSLPWGLTEGICWLDAGLQLHRAREVALVQERLKDGKLLPAKEIFAGEAGSSKDRLLRAQAMSVVEFLVERGGRRKLIRFVELALAPGGGSGGDGPWALSLNEHYGFNGFKELEAAWKKWLQNPPDPLGYSAIEADEEAMLIQADEEAMRIQAQTTDRADWLTSGLPPLIDPNKAAPFEITKLTLTRNHVDQEIMRAECRRSWLVRVLPVEVKLVILPSAGGRYAFYAPERMVQSPQPTTVFTAVGDYLLNFRGEIPGGARAYLEMRSGISFREKNPPARISRVFWIGTEEQLATAMKKGPPPSMRSGKSTSPETVPLPEAVTLPLGTPVRLWANGRTRYARIAGTAPRKRTKPC